MLLEEEHMVTSLTSPEMTSAGDTALGARAVPGRGEAAAARAGPAAAAVLAPLAPAAARPGLHLPPPAGIQVGTGYSWVTTDI